jgi:hypothetical protein
MNLRHCGKRPKTIYLEQKWKNMYERRDVEAKKERRKLNKLYNSNDQK